VRPGRWLGKLRSTQGFTRSPSEGIENGCEHDPVCADGWRERGEEVEN
jgi:hypothetical protein